MSEVGIARSWYKAGGLAHKLSEVGNRNRLALRKHVDGDRAVGSVPKQQLGLVSGLRSKTQFEVVVHKPAHLAQLAQVFHA